jgi:hypothetical protein
MDGMNHHTDDNHNVCVCVEKLDSWIILLGSLGIHVRLERMGIRTIDRHNTKLQAPFLGLQAGFMRTTPFSEST